MSRPETGNRKRERSRRLALLLFGGLMLLPTPHSLFGQDADRGKVIYEKWCVSCHGESGAGDGEAAAYMLPRPRDFTFAIYQIRTTVSGGLPTDDDLRRVIDDGMPGTTMPGWRAKLSGSERDDVIAYIKTFSDFFEDETPESIETGKPPRVTEEGLAEGRRLYVEEVQCLKCHGDAGRGDGNSAPTMTDDAGFPVRPADLTENWNFNGGGSVDDIFMRMRTGLDGTPMPSNSDVIDAGIMTEEQLWRVAQYVRSLSPKEAPQPSDVIRAALIEGTLPEGPADTAWNDFEQFWIPLVGQIIKKPRWFAPVVDGVWVQAAHDGTTLALKLSWNDPSSSPNTEWEEYFQLLAQTMTDVDGPAATEQGPDRVQVLFPLTVVEGTELPYFLGGDAKRPVYEWNWVSSPDQFSEGKSVGLGTFAAYADGQLAHEAKFEAGRWQLQISRSLAPVDSTRAPTFIPGTLVPIAFFAADGSSGEVGNRGSVSAWTSLYLDVPTPTVVFVAPVVATLLTAGLGIILVVRAQKRETGA